MPLMPPAVATTFHIVVCSPHLLDKWNHEYEDEKEAIECSYQGVFSQYMGTAWHNQCVKRMQTLDSRFGYILGQSYYTMSLKATCTGDHRVLHQHVLEEDTSRKKPLQKVRLQCMEKEPLRSSQCTYTFTLCYMQPATYQ